MPTHDDMTDDICTEKHFMVTVFGPVTFFRPKCCDHEIVLLCKYYSVKESVYFIHLLIYLSFSYAPVLTSVTMFYFSQSRISQQISVEY